MKSHKTPYHTRLDTPTQPPYARPMTTPAFPDTEQAMHDRALQPPTPAAANTAADPFPHLSARWGHAPFPTPDHFQTSTTHRHPIAIRFGPNDLIEVADTAGVWTPLNSTNRLTPVLPPPA